MKENIKIGLLSVIALTLIYNAFLLTKIKPGKNDHSKDEVAAESPINDISSAMNTVNPSQPSPTPEPTVPAVPLGPKTSMKFPEMEHAFGKVKQDSENKYIFKFKNTGNEPLIISDAKGSCGCTVPTYPKEPVAPGANGEILVVYKPGKQQGDQSKTVTITANTEPYETILKISATVEEVK